ncbi:MAG: sulfatase-like hydrolase/transferase [Bacteroidota bacterium]|nr:sulfatase-like hydrolase/transferase [Bacteroidota bacterium]
MNFSRFLKIMHGGLLFDTSAILFTNALYIFLFLIPFPFTHQSGFQKVLKYLFLITNSIALSANIADTFYFDFTTKRTAADVFMYMGEGNGFDLLKSFLISYWYGFLIGIVFILLLIFISNKLKSVKPKKLHFWTYFFSGLVILGLSGFLSVIGMRGSFVIKTFPITLGDAGNYTTKSMDMALVLNTPFSIYKTLEKRSLKKKSYFSDQELRQIINPIHPPDSEEAFDYKNVVIIVLESFSNEYIGCLNPETSPENSYTPFLDSLISAGKIFPRAFATGRQSVSALPAITAGIPFVKQAYVSSAYATNRVTSLGSELEKKGYHNSFFHGAENGSLGIDAFMTLAGYPNTYGKQEYNNDNDYDGTWGIWDEDFMQFFAHKLTTFPEPFHSVFFSLSSHNPYDIPEKYDKKFKHIKSDKHKTYAYTDFALKRFFQTINSKPWFKNSLFVVTADHSKPSRTARYANNIGLYNIPLLFYSPADSSLAGNDSTIVQQLDVMPTILNYLNYDQVFFSLGTDILKPDNEKGAITYLTNSWQYIKGNYLVEMQADTLFSLYNFSENISLSKNLIDSQRNKAEQMSRYLKAFIQEHNKRMIENSMVEDE